MEGKRAILTLRSWINPAKLDIDWLCINPNAIDYLETLDPRELSFFHLLKNPNPAKEELISENIHLITHWIHIHMARDPQFNDLYNVNRENDAKKAISQDPTQIEYLREHPDEIEWDAFSTNPAIFELQNHH